MNLAMNDTSSMPRKVSRVVLAAATLAASLQTSAARAEISSTDRRAHLWQEWADKACDEVIELRAHAPDSSAPFAIGADQELLTKIEFNPELGGESLQLGGFIPLIDNRRILADFTLYTKEVTPGEGLRRVYDWFPDDEGMAFLAPDAGFAVPRTANPLVMEVHYYNLGGRAQTDRSGVGACLVRGARKSTNVAAVVDFGTPEASIPSNVSNHVVTRTCTVRSKTPVTLSYAAPGMHRLGRAAALEIQKADGSQTYPVNAYFNFGERQTYKLFGEGVLEQGDRVTSYCLFDNPMDVDVAGGWRSTEEVCRMSVTYFPAGDFICD